MMKCTYCGGVNFFEGPSGGLSTNVLCANKACRHWFNLGPGTFEDLKRVEPTDEEKKAARTEAVAKAEDLRVAAFQEGRELFRKGSPAIACVKNKNNNQHGFAGADGGDMFRLAGYVEEMRQRVLERPMS